MTRLKNDQYFTPPGLIYPLLKEMRFDADAIYFEPCAGDGAIANCLEHHGLSEVITSDIVPTHIKEYDTGKKWHSEFYSSGMDATIAESWRNRFRIARPDWVITNPPYKQPDCDRIIQNAWEFAEEGIAMLLRLSYLEPCQNRAKFLKEANLSNLIIFNPRPQFIPGKKATDSSTVAWFVWQKDPGTPNCFGTKITFCTDWND